MSEPETPARGLARIGTLDGSRGVAILGVVMVHTSGILDGPIELGSLNVTKLWIWSGRYGVELFFVLSGLALSLSLGRQRPNSRRGLAAYYVRRFFRLSPMYYLVLAVAALTGYATVLERYTVNPPPDIRNYLIHASYLHGLFPQYARSILGAAWSLTPEVVFYATLPLLLLLAPTPIRRVLLFVAATAVSYAFNLYWSELLEPGQTNYIWSTIAPPRVFFLFTAGMVLADVYAACHAGDEGGRLRLRLADATALAGITGFYWLYYRDADALWVWLCIVVVVLGYCLGSRVLALILGLRPVQRLGLVSYSIFLIHFPIADVLRPRFKVVLGGLPPLLVYLVFFAVVLGTSWLLAAVTYRLVEQPGIALGNRWSRRVLQGKAGS